ncbi:MAG: ferrochelatase [Chitinophagaceae bacterium]|nr:ferrochelatase [Chitinophagaceae bacterium]
MKRGIVLMNLGSPDSISVKDVRRYLNEFLMDERVIDKPYLFRKILVSGIIVPFRAPKSAEAYKSIWTEKGSPLIEFTRQLQNALQQQISEPIEIAMRYGNPSVKSAYDNLQSKIPELEEVIAIPLYPHYAMSSYETAVEYAREIHAKNKYAFKLNFVKPFFNHPYYIHALTESIRPYLSQPYDHILFSYHGIPERHVMKTDGTGVHCLKVNNCCEIDSPAHATCYRHQIITTTRLVAEKLELPTGKCSFSFQSRLGRDEWLKPYTAKRFEEMPQEGIKKLLIVCPAFVADCLETLEEIAVEGRNSFIQSGGELLTVIPCLNTHPLWVKTIANWIKEYEEEGEMV